jgi:hypothetical protein
MVITERKAYERGPNDPKHYLVRGTLVRVVRETELGTFVTETLYPVFGVEDTFNGYRYETRTQYLDRDDFVYLSECLAPMVEAGADLFRKTREFLGV